MLASKRLLLNASSPVGSGSTYLDSAHVESNGGVVRDVLNRCRSSLGSAEGGSARNNLESSRAAFHSKVGYLNVREQAVLCLILCGIVLRFR